MLGALVSFLSNHTLESDDLHSLNNQIMSGDDVNDIVSHHDTAQPAISAQSTDSIQNSIFMKGCIGLVLFTLTAFLLLTTTLIFYYRRNQKQVYEYELDMECMQEVKEVDPPIIYDYKIELLAVFFVSLISFLLIGFLVHILIIRKGGKYIVGKENDLFDPFNEEDVGDNFDLVDVQEQHEEETVETSVSSTHVQTASTTTNSIRIPVKQNSQNENDVTAFLTYFDDLLTSDYQRFVQAMKEDEAFDKLPLADTLLRVLDVKGKEHTIMVSKHDTIIDACRRVNHDRKESDMQILVPESGKMRIHNLTRYCEKTNEEIDLKSLYSTRVHR